MKYIINESRLQDLIWKYLDGLVESSKKILTPDPFRSLDGPDKSYVLVITTDDYIQNHFKFTYRDNHLWIYVHIVNSVKDMFALERESTIKPICKWFERKYDVSVDGWGITSGSN